MQFIDASLGVILLLFGRRLYWLLVAVAGFLVGMHMGEVFLADQANWVRLLAAVGAGVVGALIAMLAQRIAFALGGLLAGGYLALAIVQPGNNGNDHLMWFLIGGIIGAVAAALILDWAIIILSSLVGAVAISAALPLGNSAILTGSVFLVLAATGIAYQANQRETEEEEE